MSEVYKAPEAQLHDDTKPGEYGSIESALAGTYQFSPIEIIKEAWEKINGFKLVYWLAIIVYMLVAVGIALISGLVFPEVDPQNPGALGPLVGALASQLLSMIVTLPLFAGLFMMTLKRSVGAQVQFGELFKHFDKALPLLFTSILMYIFIIIGFILLVLPGIYLMVAFSLALPLVVEKGMSPMEALSTSRKAITHRWFSFLVFLLLSFFVALAGSLVFVIGLIWALPVAGLAYGIVYRNVMGVETSTLSDS